MRLTPEAQTSKFGGDLGARGILSMAERAKSGGKALKKISSASLAGGEIMPT